MLIKIIFICLTLSSTFVLAENNANVETIFTPNQTSASLLVNYAKKLMLRAKPEQKQEAERKYLLIYDIYIKARSYALLNKVFFWLSIAFGLAVLLWPSLSIIFKNNLSKWEWVKSATVQTTVTGLAALMFAFYTQYKDKQTYAETLMRHATYSEISASELSIKVSEELARIDRGFSFNSIVGKKSVNN